jgi:hypothetical protein
VLGSAELPFEDRLLDVRRELQQRHDVRRVRLLIRLRG